VASRRLALGSRVRARTKPEAERVGKYMVRPVLALDRLLLLEREGKVGYRWGGAAAELESMDYLELIARVTSHIPDKGQVMVRYYGLYANAHRGKVGKADRVPVALIRHLELTFAAEKPPPVHVFEQVALMAAASACTHGDVFAAP